MAGSSFLIEQDLFRKTVPTFRHHAPEIAPARMACRSSGEALILGIGCLSNRQKAKEVRLSDRPAATTCQRRKSKSNGTVRVVARPVGGGGTGEARRTIACDS